MSERKFIHFLDLSEEDRDQEMKKAEAKLGKLLDRAFEEYDDFIASQTIKEQR